MSVKCKRPNCPGRAHPTKNLGLCSTHYGNVRKGLVDATECKAHVSALRKMGYSMRRIAAESGLDTDTLTNLGEWHPGSRVRLSTHEKIMRIPLPAQVVNGGSQALPNVGTRRRLQALVAAGYSNEFIAAEFGISAVNVGQWLRRDYVSAETLDRVRELFNRLQLVPGPSDHARRRAQRLGWQPPLAWDEEDIDNPSAKPCQQSSLSMDEFLVQYEKWRARGYGNARIAAELGVHLRSLEKRLWRSRRRETAAA